jgi:hypothetical protein
MGGFLQKRNRCYFQCLGKLFERVYCDVTLPSLNATNVCTVESRQVSELVLGNAEFGSQTTNVSPDYLVQVCVWLSQTGKGYQ